MQNKNEIVESVAKSLAERFEQQTGLLIDQLSHGLVDAVLQMEDLYVQGTGILTSLTDNPKDVSSEELNNYRKAIRCILAYARLGANSFHKTMIEKEREDPQLVPVQLVNLQLQFHQLFAAMEERWNSGLGEQNFSELMSSIGEHLHEVTILLHEPKPNTELFTICCADICNHLVQLMNKVNQYKEN